LKTTGRKDWGQCFTCPAHKPLTELHAGHFVDGRGNSVLFQEDGVHAQCVQCNIFKSGNKDVYTPRMIEMYGLVRVEELQAEKKVIKRFTDSELVEIADKYELAYKKLLEGTN